MVSTQTPKASSPYDAWILDLVSTPLLDLASNHLSKRAWLDEPSTSQGESSCLKAKLEQAFQDLENERSLHHRTSTALKTTRTTLKEARTSFKAEFNLRAEAEISRDTHQEANSTLTETVNTLRGELNDVRASHTDINIELPCSNTFAFLQTHWRLE